MTDERKTRAEQIIDKHKGYLYGIDEAGLGSEITRIALNEPGVVFMFSRF